MPLHVLSVVDGGGGGGKRVLIAFIRFLHNNNNVHESTQPNVNSILKSAAKIIEELSQLSGKNDAKLAEMQHMKGRLGELLKKKWKNKVMHGQYIRNMDRQLISEEDTFLL